MYNVKLKAADFNISELAAIRMRIRFLLDQVDAYAASDDPVSEVWAYEAIDEALKLLKQRLYKQPTESGALTEEQIQRAKDYPIEQLLDFKNKKTTAFCHEDKSPSLTHWKAANKAKCFACNLLFNPIDVLMVRDGQTFRQAVLNLQ